MNSNHHTEFGHFTMQDEAGKSVAVYLLDDVYINNKRYFLALEEDNTSETGFSVTFLRETIEQNGISYAYPDDETEFNIVSEAFSQKKIVPTSFIQ